MNTIFLGRLTKDPELRHISTGTAVLNLNVATEYGYGERKATEFVQISVWGDRGEKLESLFKKGDMYLFFATYNGLRTYEKRDGTTGVTLQYNLDSFKFLPGGGRTTSASEVTGDPAPWDDDSPF